MKQRIKDLKSLCDMNSTMSPSTFDGYEKLMISHTKNITPT